MEWVETTAKTVDEARERALDLLGVDSADAEVEVIDEGKIGLFGRVKTEARIRARIRPKAPPARNDRRNRRGGGSGGGGNRGGGNRGGRNRGGRNRDGGNRDGGNRDGGNRGGGNRDGGNRDGGNRDGGSRDGNKQSSGQNRGNRGGNKQDGGQNQGGGRGGSRDGNKQDGGRNRDSGRNQGADSSKSQADGSDTTQGAATAAVAGAAGAAAAGGKRGGRNDRNNRNNSESRDKKADNVSDEEFPVEEQEAVMVDFLTGLVEAFDTEADVTTSDDGENLEGQVNGNDVGLMIGPSGATLNAIEELARTTMQRAAAGRRYRRLRVDVDGHRQRRRDALAAFVTKLAADVSDSGERKALEPMSSADRKVVHDTIADIDGVDTVSEGDDPRRHVVLVPAED